MKRHIDIFHICGFMFNAKNNKVVDWNFIKKNVAKDNNVTIRTANVKEARWVFEQHKNGNLNNK